MASKLEKDYMGMVAELPCMLCGAHGVQVHHVREGKGLSQRAGNFLVIPLCWACHLGPMGIHGDKAMLRIHKCTELDLVDKTISLIMARLFK